MPIRQGIFCMARKVVVNRTIWIANHSALLNCVLCGADLAFECKMRARNTRDTSRDELPDSAPPNLSCRAGYDSRASTYCLLRTTSGFLPSQE